MRPDPGARNDRARLIGGARRLVVKLGSSLLAPRGAGVRRERLRALASQVAALRRGGREVVLVSSGAIASGMRALRVRRRPSSVAEQQALAAVGQPDLMRAYAEAFARHRIAVAQVLLTQDDLLARRRALNARQAVEALLRRGVLPVVNENDMVAVEEIRLGDNDQLSAHTALLVGADVLVLLTDAGGLYEADPRRTRGGRRLSVVERVTPEIRRMAGRAPGSAVGSGGMATKLGAAQIVTRAGSAVLIAGGADPRVLLRAAAGEDVGTLLLPSPERMSSRKRWLAFGGRTRGAIVVDRGAREALERKGRSLLPGGVIRAEGAFEPGDAVSLKDEDGAEFGRGLAAYSAAEVARIRGRKAAAIAGVLGVFRGEEVVHRDRLVLLEP